MPYKPIINIDNGVPCDVRVMWRKIITACMSCLDTETCRVTPPFYIYNTLVECLYHTFYPSHPMVDKLLDQYAQDKVWSFAFLQEPQMRNPKIPETEFQRIVIASSRNVITPDLSPEMVVLHEVGHFDQFLRHGVPYNNTTKIMVENACNEFASVKYGRLIAMHPQYTTYSSDKALRKCETFIREYVRQRKEAGVTDENIFAEIEQLMRTPVI